MVSTLSLRTIEDCAVTVPTTVRLLEVSKVAQSEPPVVTVTLELAAACTFEVPFVIAVASTETVCH